MLNLFVFLMFLLFNFSVLALDLNPTTIPPDSVGYTTSRLGNTAQAPTPSVSDVKMRFTCTHAKIGRFDPIVAPGDSNFWHWHQFIGNAGINPNSTPDSIKNSGNSTCFGGTQMRSAYWFPVLYDTSTGGVIQTSGAIIYYTTGTSQKATQQLTQAFPDGLVMIAGNARNTVPNTVEYNRRKIYFKCYTPGVTGSATELLPEIPLCKKGDILQAQVSFRNCWDGKNLDSPDHQSHMAYSGNGAPAPSYCPSTHPVRVIDIGITISYPVTTTTTQFWRYSSDMYNPALPGGYSFHADFMNGSSDYVKKMLVENCFKAGMDCGMGLLGRDPVDGLLKRVY